VLRGDDVRGLDRGWDGPGLRGVTCCEQIVFGGLDKWWEVKGSVCGNVVMRGDFISGIG